MPPRNNIRNVEKISYFKLNEFLIQPEAGTENKDIQLESKKFYCSAMSILTQTPAGTPLFPVPRGERVSPFPED